MVEADVGVGIVEDFEVGTGIGMVEADVGEDFGIGTGMVDVGTGNDVARIDVVRAVVVGVIFNRGGMMGTLTEELIGKGMVLKGRGTEPEGMGMELEGNETVLGIEPVGRGMAADGKGIVGRGAAFPLRSGI